MHAQAQAHPWWGYRKIHRLLVDDGWAVNVKRIERLWRAEGLKVPPADDTASKPPQLQRDRPGR
ncbi:hypothetical protein GCM10009814_40630 [Lapillicoccus jejuensis]